ncbi:MAG TPA: hypothetical protein VGS27_18835, partial [Candidatus Sulfotelmatobacter sp.]|nr:hypothetical protein [Candidatus Sulfotelmatobacter sp.]
MKTQAWGWLAVAVIAAGLNANYHDGGMPWAHQIIDQVQHNSRAVMALATGHADQFLTEAGLLTTRNEVASCRFSEAIARVQSRIAESEANFDRFRAMSDREEAQLVRFEANRARIEARMAQVRIPAVTFNPVVVRVPRIDVCPRI